MSKLSHGNEEMMEQIECQAEPNESMMVQTVDIVCVRIGDIDFGVVGHNGNTLKELEDACLLIRAAPKVLQALEGIIKHYHGDPIVELFDAHRVIAKAKGTTR